MPRVYFDKVDASVTRVDLHEFFSKAGEVRSVMLITDKASGKSRGYGCVDMATLDEAVYAIKWLKNSKIKGGSIRIDPVPPRA